MGNLKAVDEMIKEVSAEELLGREAIELECKEISKYINRKTILVTGGGVFIGSELCRQIAKVQELVPSYSFKSYSVQAEVEKEVAQTYAEENTFNILVAT